MAILRHHHTRDFTIVPNSLIQNENLSLRDIGLLIYMLSLPDDWEFSIRGLDAIFKNDGRDAVSVSLKRIEAAGYLTREAERKGGKFCAVVWIVSDEPMSPCTEKPDTVKPNTANPSQIKNHINKGRTEQRT